ncbi:hypothetical protein F5J12DRAFT_41507 [Pisolithus orientalis]|uniref:uncharacterized protein n=1 Tax=Pisolithus orientalis TaxID=936130 RepID=UPI002224453A|nr:uncharacterized protein F5J12DRAFT_41507 [Pisolithus orientalis]KAI6009527.1 hypothetical protein F5J12DRAFT_41507 [Pisolithus orientalis]
MNFSSADRFSCNRCCVPCVCRSTYHLSYPHSVVDYRINLWIVGCEGPVSHPSPRCYIATCLRGRDTSIGRTETQKMYKRLLPVAKEIPIHISSPTISPLSLKPSLSSYTTMFSRTFLSAVAASVLFVASASAICPGYNFGIAQAGGQMNGNNGVWQVYDNSCNVVHQATGQMPCGGGVFDCNSAQTTFTGLHPRWCQLCLQPRH